MTRPYLPLCDAGQRHARGLQVRICCVSQGIAPDCLRCRCIVDVLHIRTVIDLREEKEAQRDSGSHNLRPLFFPASWDALSTRAGDRHIVVCKLSRIRNTIWSDTNSRFLSVQPVPSEASLQVLVFRVVASAAATYCATFSEQPLPVFETHRSQNIHGGHEQRRLAE